MYMSGYRCFSCAAAQGADFAGFLCPACGGNLDIRYDYAAAAKTLAEDLAQDLARYSRDLFRYRALLPLRKSTTTFPLRIGGTPLVRAPRLGSRHRGDRPEGH